MFIIRSKNDGFRRCGIAHTKAGKEFADDFFTEDQLAALKADPMITVDYVNDPAPATDPFYNPDPEPETEPASRKKSKNRSPAAGR